MGRKIPAKRHRGVRDPIKKNHEKFLKIKDKINNPPQNINEQPISRSTVQFIKMKEAAKAGNFRQNSGIEDVPKPRKKKNKMDLPREFKYVPEHKPFKGETARDFLRRVNKATQQGLKEAHYEAKYNVDIVRKDSGVEVKKRPVDAKGAPTQSKMVKFNAKKKMKKEKRESQKKEEQELDNRFSKKDVVKFGEVCHRPPELKVIRKADKNSESVGRPGRKNLLLNSLFKS